MAALLLLPALSAPTRANAALPPPALDLRVLWTTDVGTLLESAPTVVDLDHDGRDEVVVAGREELVALGAGGKERWRWRTEGRFMTYPAAWQRPAAPALLYAADTGGTLTCLDGRGRVVWRNRLHGPASWSATAVVDLDGDGTPEVVQTDDKGTVWAFRATDGAKVWEASVRGASVSPAVGDLAGNDRPEVVVATAAGELTVLRADGRPLWTRRTGGEAPSWSVCAPILFAGGDGRRRILLATNDRQLTCWNAAGDRLWEHQLTSPAASSLSAGDVDGDGHADLFAITQLGRVWRLAETGEVRWRLDLGERCLAAGALVDLTGDGRPEYALCTQRGRLLVLDAGGEALFDHQFPSRTINVTPTFGEIEPDQPGRELAITGGEFGRVYCLSTPATDLTTAPWSAYRGNRRKQGAWFASRPAAAVLMRPVNLSWDRLLVGEGVRFKVTAPADAPRPLVATAACRLPNGESERRTIRLPGTPGELRLTLPLDIPGEHRFTWSLRNAAGRELARGERTVAVRPFANDQALAQAAARSLEQTATGLAEPAPASAAALRREAALLRADLASLRPVQDTMATASPPVRRRVVARTARLNARARRGAALARLCRAAKTDELQAGFVVFEGPLWENGEVNHRLPERMAGSLELNRRAVPGEHDPVSLRLLNLTDRELHVRALVASRTNGPAFRLHYSLPTPTSVGTLAWDALPELTSPGVLGLPSLAARELWLDADLTGTAPGEHEIILRLQALDGPGVLDGPSTPRTEAPPEVRVAVRWRVLPFEPAPPSAFRLCTWPRLDAGALPDLLAHGNNVFPLPFPKPRHDAEGHWTGTDYAALDRLIAAVRGHDVVLLLQGIPGFGVPEDSAAYRAALAACLGDLTDHLRARGFDRDHFALYPLDEPCGAGWAAVNRFVAFGRRVRAVDPKLRLYLDGGGEPPMYEALAPVVDIWCPAITMLAERSPVMELVRRDAGWLWSYDCAYPYARPVGPNIKSLNLVGQFRLAALQAFRHHATGIGYWCYNLGGDPWTRIKDEYPLVYPGADRPIPSRRWEAVREGIEDCRLLAALRTRLDAAAPAALTAEQRARLTALLREELPALVDPGIQAVALGVGASVLDATHREVDLNAFRAKVLDIVEALEHFNKYYSRSGQTN